MRISKEVMLFKPKATELGIEDAGTKATKHITTIGDDGIRVHDAYHNATNFVQIDSSGMEVYKGGESVGLFGAIARIGKVLKARFMLNADSLQAYDNSNNLYFEVSADGLTYGSNTAASTDDVNDAVSSALSSTTVKTQYYLSTSSSSATGGTWSDTVPTWSSGTYIWTRVATTKATVGGSSETTYSTAVYDKALTTALSTASSASSAASSASSAASAAQTSANGAASTVTTTQQFNLSTSTSSATGTWSDSAPTWSTGKYVWTRYKIVKVTVGGTTTTSYTTGVYDKTLTDALSSAEEAAKTATNYMYFNSSTGLDIASADPATATRKVNISADGIKIQNDANNYAKVNSGGMEVYQGGTSVAEFGSSGARIGKESSVHSVIDSSALYLVDGNDDNIARIGAWTRLGYEDGQHLMLESGRMEFYGQNGRGIFQIKSTSSTQSERICVTASTLSYTFSYAPVTGEEIVVYVSYSTTSKWSATFTAGTSATVDQTSKYGCTLAYNAISQTLTLTVTGDTAYKITRILYYASIPFTTYNLGQRIISVQESAGFASLIQGIEVEARGDCSSAFGRGTVAVSDNQMAVGKYNAEYSDGLFIVGRGSGSVPSNAMAVDTSGNLHVYGDIYANCSADSSGGTAVAMQVLKVTKSSVSSLSTTITNSAITSDMEVLHSVLSNPSAQTGDWTVTTSNGSLTIAGSISGTTNITLYLAEPRT